jgi:aspartate/methionine/tyrosine aminotransferase
VRILSEPLRAVPRSGIGELSALAMQTPRAIRLEVGEPDFQPPAHVLEAARRAIEGGRHGYTPAAGLPSLRERLAFKLERVNGIQVGPDQVICGPGGIGVLAASLTAVCQPGDEVLVPDPGWPNYLPLLAGLHASPVRYPCPPELSFLPDLDRLDRLVGPRARVLLVNSPNNPSGRTYAPDVLQGLAAVAERHDLWVLSDECYDQTLMDGTPVAPGMWGRVDPERLVSCFTFSKTYAMPGWRLGYAAAPAAVAPSMAKALEGTSNGPATISQLAGEAALDGPQDCVLAMADTYRRRRDAVVELLKEAGMLVSVPEGTFFVLASVAAAGMDSRDLALSLLRERCVAVAPGSTFGLVAADTVRISLTRGDEELVEGVRRLCEFVVELSGLRGLR